MNLSKLSQDSIMMSMDSGGQSTPDSLHEYTFSRLQQPPSAVVVEKRSPRQQLMKQRSLDIAVLQTLAETVEEDPAFADRTSSVPGSSSVFGPSYRRGGSGESTDELVNLSDVSVENHSNPSSFASSSLPFNSNDDSRRSTNATADVTGAVSHSWIGAADCGSARNTATASKLIVNVTSGKTSPVKEAGIKSRGWQSLRKIITLESEDDVDVKTNSRTDKKS